MRLTAGQIARVVDRPLGLAASATAQRGAVLAQAAHSSLASAERAGSERKLSRARAALATAEKVQATAREMRLLAGDPASAVRSKDGKPLALRVRACCRAARARRSCGPPASASPGC
ncbi:hypothetical protein IHE61_00925 [Streptomyces sp. GKU 257-1]|nr:hypothetical protein [Streptomyces sp. GKU 257-1]